MQRHTFLSRLSIAILLCLTSAMIAIRTGEPAQPTGFKDAGVVEAWNTYKYKLTFGKG
jgi:hypothetical protein